jgi:hypothetical protein
MNRTAAQASGILGVELPQVKRMAVEFKDYLSKAANPEKGTTRIFNDNDLLVLIYVGHSWEDEPDLECIKIGLNRDEHHDDPYLEELYLRTPLIQESPDGLDETWRHGILLVGGGRYEHLELARGYRTIADTMLDAAIEKDDLQQSAYPILFAYRHTLELYLKIIGEIDEHTHKLKECVRLVENRRNQKLPSPMREWIFELDQIDPHGTSFRYADADSAMNDHYEEWFDFRHFQFAMKRVFDAIDLAILRVRDREPSERSPG